MLRRIVTDDLIAPSVTELGREVGILLAIPVLLYLRGLLGRDDDMNLGLWSWELSALDDDTMYRYLDDCNAKTKLVL